MLTRDKRADVLHCVAQMQQPRPAKKSSHYF
jgi:hypothetical protein